MTFFSIIEDGQAILTNRGVYRQVKIYTRGEGERIYAKYGAGFVRLAQGGSTSAPNVRWAEIDPGEGNFTESKGQVNYVAPTDHKVAAE